MYMCMLAYVLAFEKPQAVMIDQIELAHTCSLSGSPVVSFS